MAKDLRWQALFEKTQEVVSDKLSISIDYISPNASFLDDLGADSLDLVELIMALEDELGLDIPDEEAERLVTVGKAVDYMYNLGLKP